jgi:ATP phosphoribosyltransferase
LLKNTNDKLLETIAEKEQVIVDLRVARENVKALKGLLPICSSCKKIRDDQGYWQAVETYVKQRSEAEFTHGICPECVQKFYPGINLE